MCSDNFGSAFFNLHIFVACDFNQTPVVMPALLIEIDLYYRLLETSGGWITKQSTHFFALQFKPNILFAAT